MPGILSFGAYVPPTRLGFALMSGGAPGDGGPERAVAWSDEDSVTMAVAAAINCLRGFERASVDALFFASTTQPFAEKQAAALIAKALDLRRDLRTSDFAGTLRAGSDALSAACDAVAAGSVGNVLLIASDCRLAPPGSALERNFGDGAAAFLIGAPGAIASIEGSYAFSEEIVDLWRAAGDTFVHSWEERFVVQQGYSAGICEAVKGLLTRLDADASDFAKFAIAAPDARSHKAAAHALGLSEASLVAPCFGQLGSAGVAFAPLLLVSALEAAQPGERLLLANYGDGGAAHAFVVNDHIQKLAPRRGLAWHLAKRRAVPRYEHYLRARELTAREFPEGAGPGLSATVHFREREDEISFLAQRCKACGALQFPAQRICESCFAKDAFSRVRLSDKSGAVVSYTLDYFFPTPVPPTIVSVVEVEGARVHLQLVDAQPDEIHPGFPVEFSFRRIHSKGGRPNYYWKAVPRARERG